MVVVDSDKVAFFDVDDTLILWDYKGEAEEYVQIGEERVVPHKKHIEILKQFHSRGQMVVVWSQGGWRWAETVVEKLGLKEYVDVVMCKPAWYFDDIPAKEWMGKRYYEDM